MSMFSSLPEFNNDPLPWVCDVHGRSCRWPSPAPGRSSKPLPAHTVQKNNETNPILTEFRTYASMHGSAPDLAEHWTRTPYAWSEMCLRDDVLVDEPLGTPEQEDHAYRVLSRLGRVFS